MQELFLRLLCLRILLLRLLFQVVHFHFLTLTFLTPLRNPWENRYRLFLLVHFPFEITFLPVLLVQGLLALLLLVHDPPSLQRF